MRFSLSIHLGFLVACAGTAVAQQSYLTNEVSTDGGVSWSTSATVLPGASVQVRVRCRFIGLDPVLGLASVIHQPTLSNWRADLGDQHNSFTFPGLSMGSPDYGSATTETSYEGRPVANLPQNTGRIFPFGLALQNESSASGLIRSFNDPGNILRISGAENSHPVNNYNPHGVISQQPTAVAAGTNFASSRNVTVFKYSVTLSNSTMPRTMIADVPLTYIASYGGFNTDPLSFWYLSSNGLQRLPVSMSESMKATINVVPSPGALFVAFVGMAIAGRRRSRS